MKIGVVGLGSIGMRHLQNAEALGHAVMGFDPAKRPSPNTCGSVEVLYDWCDAAVIATPSPLHEDGLRACVKRGKHCLIEKPLGTAIGAFPELLAEAKLLGLKVMMGNNLRFHPCIKDLRNAGLGPAHHAIFICATTTDKPTYLSDGVVLCTGSHEVDLALMLFGPATLKTATGLGEESASFVLRHACGTRSLFHLDFLTQPECRKIAVFRTRSTTHIDLPGRTSGTNFGLRHETSERFPGSYDDDYVDEMRTFISLIENPRLAETENPALGVDGLDTLRLLLDIRQRIGLPHV